MGIHSTKARRPIRGHCDDVAMGWAGVEMARSGELGPFHTGMAAEPEAERRAWEQHERPGTRGGGPRVAVRPPAYPLGSCH